MPADDSLRLDHDEGRLPAPSHGRQRYPYHPLRWAETWSPHAALQHMQLMAERHILDHDVPMYATTYGAPRTINNTSSNMERIVVSAASRNQRQHEADVILANDNREFCDIEAGTAPFFETRTRVLTRTNSVFHSKSNSVGCDFAAFVRGFGCA
jgi:hypothetical protein